MLSCVSDNPQNCQITNIQIISNLLNHEPSCQTIGCILVKRGPIASEIAVRCRRLVTYENDRLLCESVWHAADTEDSWSGGCDRRMTVALNVE